jgi:uncharacterized protein (DUF2252 family)
MATIFERIQQFNAGRVPELLAFKYQFISEDPFRFYRGTCHLFYEDLSKHITWKDDTKVWICGDLHLENFGTYKGDNRVVYFDMNDFDEALQAPATWELVRMLTSIHVAAHSVPYDAKMADKLCRIYLTEYIRVLETGKPLTIDKETAQGLLKYFIQQLQLRKESALVGSKMQTKNGTAKLLVNNQKSLPVAPEIKVKVMNRLNNWLKKQGEKERYKVVDISYRIAGTGSVGCQRYMLLVTKKKSGPWHLLDLKEAMPSSLLPYVKIPQPTWDNEAQRVVTLQKRIQHVSPSMLNVIKIGKTPFVIKELQPSADRMDLTLCKGKLTKLSKILTVMAQANASGQLRSAGRQGSSIADELITFAHHTQPWKTKVLQYARKYALQVMADYEAYCKQYQKSTKIASK